MILPEESITHMALWVSTKSYYITQLSMAMTWLKSSEVLQGVEAGRKYNLHSPFPPLFESYSYIWIYACIGWPTSLVFWRSLYPHPPLLCSLFTVHFGNFWRFFSIFRLKNVHHICGHPTYTSTTAHTFNANSFHFIWDLRNF